MLVTPKKLRQSRWSTLLLVAAAFVQLTGSASAQNQLMPGPPVPHGVKKVRRWKTNDGKSKSTTITKLRPKSFLIKSPKNPWADVRPTTAAPTSKNNQ